MVDKNPISLLQERSMRNRGALPIYQMESIGTTEVPKFKCTVKTLEVTAEGEARNKKDAKQIAAENALIQLGYKISPMNRPEPVEIQPIEAPPDSYNPYRNYIGILNEFASGNQQHYPDYQDAIFSDNGQFKIVCKFMDLVTEGFAKNKKEAKRLAAFKMMECLKDMKFPLNRTVNPPLINNPSKPASVVLDSKDNIIIDKFSELSVTSYSKSTANSYGIDIKPHPEIKTNVYTIEEAGDIIRSLGFNFKLKTMQTDPYIVAIQLVGKEFTLLGVGNTERDATKKVMNDSLEFIRGGCSSFVPDTNLPYRS